jgi:ADP-heptose:LPS heptosyltransferase
MANKKKLIIKHNRAPGDIMTLTTLIRDIHLTYPGEYETAVDTSAKDLWRHNPYIVPAGKGFTEYKA